MEISNFKMGCTPEQSRVVQEFLFKNGYKWCDDTTEVSCLEEPCLILDLEDEGGLRWVENYNFAEENIPELTFEQFKELYMQEAKSLRYNEGKPKWSLVDFKSLEPMVRVLEYGCTKYEKNNWKKGLDNTEVLESLSRHLFALMSGEELDPESQLPHIGHIMCNALFYQYHKNKENE